MRDWSLGSGDPLYLTLAADARLSTPVYVDDHIWEMEFGGGDPPALSLYTTYGLRARSMRIFPRFVEGGSVVTNPETFAKPPRLRRFYPNFRAVECSPFENLEVSAEYWVPESHAIAGRFALVNRTTATRQIRVEICGNLAPLDGKSLVTTQQQMVNILAGQTGELFPVLFMTGGPTHGPGPYPSLMLDLEMGPGASRQFTFAQAALKGIPESFELARRVAARAWEAERARIELINESQTIDIRTGDTDWDAALAFSQTAALGLFFPGNDKLPKPSFVQSRQPENGFSRKGDGSDYPPAWNGQSPIESYYISNILPGAPRVLKDLLNNFFSTQTEDGRVDNKPGLNGSRGKFIAAPILSRLVWKFYKDTQDPSFLAEFFPKALKFFTAWFSAEHDRDGDGIPEWDHVLQCGFEDNPLFDAWHPWSQGLDISLVNSPSLAAMLYSEAACLIRMAEMIGSADDLALLHAHADALRSAVRAGWNARSGLYCYRDHETGVLSAGKVIAKHKGDGNMRTKASFEKPTRLLIEVQTKNPAAKRPEVEISDRFSKGEVEIIEAHQFQWRSGGLIAASKKTYSKVGRVAVRGLDAKDKIIVKTVDTSGEDLTLALPLWANIPEEQHAHVMMGRALMDAERFYRPYGFPALPLPPDPQTDTVSMSVHLPWNALICEGMLAYGLRKEAALIAAHLMFGVIQSLKQNHSFYQRYHAETGTALGERNSLNGLAPVDLFLQTLGVKIFSRERVRLEGSNPFPWPVTIKYKGLTVARGFEETTITFPNGKSVTITDPAPCMAEM